ncbi:hypothetical protein [Micromonospora chalcea]|uniref:hypothetical protein n=1 Tax=Micromonospora chalcea TaxID=1874 RepID=UPI003D710A5B
MKQKLNTGGEHDVVGRGRRFYTYLQRPGVTSKIKRGLRARARRDGKRQTDERVWAEGL